MTPVQRDPIEGAASERVVPAGPRGHWLFGSVRDYNADPLDSLLGPGANTAMSSRSS